MSLREYMQRIQQDGGLTSISEPISKQYQLAGVLKELEPQPVLVEKVLESHLGVVGNLFCTKKSFADYLNIQPNQIIQRLSDAIQKRSPCEIIRDAPCQEVVISNPDLDTLPIPRHFEKDGGNYLTSGVFIARHPRFGQNADYHRGMQFSKREMSIRVVEGRHFDRFLNDLGQLDVAVCLGNPPNVLVAAATSIEIGVDEMEIANALEAVQVVKGKTVDVLLPAQAEIVLEGTVYRDRRHSEGPFVDLTETMDAVRYEPVFEVKTITHRRDALWHALLPGGLEHKLLMGMPREPTIFRHVNQVVRCLDVNVNPGGCSWLHAVVQIDKQSPDDGRKAILAAFEGHRSCKHVFVVDSDIDIYDPLAVEWAMATRFQGDRDLVVLDREAGSSLDPSAEPGSRLTTKMGFDLTMPLGEDSAGYKKVPYPQVNTRKFFNQTR